MNINDIKLLNNDTVFMMTCGKVKYHFEYDVPLHKLYKGAFHNARQDFINLVAGKNNYYYVTPSGPGIVSATTLCGYYDMITPNCKLIDETFIIKHRENAYKHSPILKTAKNVYYIGDIRYFTFLQKVFYDKNIIMIFNEKSGMGTQIGLLRRFVNYYNKPTYFKHLKIQDDNKIIILYKRNKVEFLNVFTKKDNLYINDVEIKPHTYINKFLKNNKIDVAKYIPRSNSRILLSIVSKIINPVFGCNWVKEEIKFDDKIDYYLNKYFNKNIVKLLKET